MKAGEWIILGVIASLVFLLLGCKTKIYYIPVKQDSIVYRVRRDSFLYKQSDSIYIHEKNDTVFYEKYRTIYSDRTKIDTLFVEKTQEVPVPMPEEIRQVVPKWCWWLLVIFFLWATGWAVRLILRFKS